MMTFHPGDMLNRILGRGRHAVTVPVMDGPLQPNQQLEAARTLLEIEAIDNLSLSADGAWLSAGAQLYRLDQDNGAVRATADRSCDDVICCLAQDDGGALAIGLDRGAIEISGGRHDGLRINATDGAHAPTACLFTAPDTLIVANGSRDHLPSRWKDDLMSLGHSGSVVRVDLRTGATTVLADGLAYPLGLGQGAGGRIFVSESWRHRVVALNPDGGITEVVLDELPGYPARMSPARDGGWWLTIFAPRTQICEFVLTETRYRQRMMAEIDPEFWIAPDLTTGRSFREPMQGGALKQMGILKPWAPARSYGLLVRCDAAMTPLTSFHSRADGTNHGITSVADADGFPLMVTAKGPGRLLSLDTADAGGRHVATA